MPAPTIALVGAEFEENLSLRYLASSVQNAGFAAEIVPFNHFSALERVVDATLAVAPLVVGISVPFQLRARELLSLAGELRRRGFDGHITIGGHFATFEFENILRDYPAIDSVVRHEGEEPFRWICEQVRDGRAVTARPGVVVRRGDGVDVGPAHPLPALDTLPFPDRRGEPGSAMGVRAAPLVGSRGCYADCSFCCIYAYADNANGARYRRRSPENIVAEMSQLYHERGVRLFIFQDDNFFLPTVAPNIARYRRLQELMREEGMERIGLIIKCRPNDVDPELFALLKEMGLIRAYVGIETNSDEGIVSLNRRITAEDNRRAMRILRDLGVYNSFNILIFDPEATLDGVAANLDFMADHADFAFNFCRTEVYAGTPIKRMLESQGRLQGDYLAWNYEMRDERVELLFRITLLAFNRRNFDSDGVHALNMGTRFDHEVVRRFYPDVWCDAWGDEALSLSMRVGTDSVAHMRRALSFVRACDPYDDEAVRSFALDLARAVAASDLTFIAEMKMMRRRLEVALKERARDADTAPVWAAETRRLASSTGRELSTESLPAPSAATGGLK
ncbi:MAG TPA: radical SAM protein [Candidatus Krumholzibacteria bacterium]